MFRDYWKYDWVLDVHRYESVSDLCATFEEAVVLPAERKMSELEERRRIARDG
ncbi:MAG TPA: hypothetical protein VK579_05260 [Terriglobales bacterium]|jgi:hypothetical protein|nr:hypothetical protein [Terriglobales bacterium]